MSYQKITIVGNVGRDAEIAYTRQGIAVLKFSVAVNKTIGKGDDKRQTTTWFNVTLWRERAEALASYIKAGMQVLVMGEVTASAYIGKDGKPAASLELTADDVKLLTSKQEMDRRADHDRDDNDAPDTEPEPRSQPARSQANANGKTQSSRAKRSVDDGSEIPF